MASFKRPWLTGSTGCLPDVRMHTSGSITHIKTNGFQKSTGSAGCVAHRSRVEVLVYQGAIRI